jgi:dipeptidyl-peptidase-4
VVRPRGFDPKKRYPVIDAAYAGPSVAVVVASRDAYLRYQIVADALDAIVVAVDAKGTPYRGRAWSRAIAGDLGRVPVQGHRDAIVALAARYPQMDLSRVGVFGWSYGGFFSAYAGLAHPDFYRAAVAGAPVVDWRDYDTAYTERYLGLPQENAKAYDRSSPLSLLSQGGSPTSSTERPSAPSRTALLLVHGTADDNVYFLHTLRMAQALDRAGHPYELMPLPGQTHAVSDPDANVAYLRRMFRFFRRELNAR